MRHQPSGARRRSHLRRGNLVRKPARLEADTWARVRLQAWPLIAGAGLGYRSGRRGVKLAYDLDLEKMVAYFVESQVAARKTFERLGFRKEDGARPPGRRHSAAPSATCSSTPVTSLQHLGRDGSHWWKTSGRTKDSSEAPLWAPRQVAMRRFSPGSARWACRRSTVAPWPSASTLIGRLVPDYTRTAAVRRLGKGLEGGVFDVRGSGPVCSRAHRFRASGSRPRWPE